MRTFSAPPVLLRVLGFRKLRWNIFLRAETFACLLLLLLSSLARADGLVLTVDANNITLVPNSPTVQQVTITGSVQNNFSFDVLTSLEYTSSILCAGCSINPTYNQAFPGCFADCYPIAAGASTGDITLATLFIAPDRSGLLFVDTFSITSGNGNSNSITVTGSAIPEPSSLVLLGTGLIGGIGAMRRKLSK